jgi:hypothetical protein
MLASLQNRTISSPNVHSKHAARRQATFSCFVVRLRLEQQKKCTDESIGLQRFPRCLMACAGRGPGEDSN